KIRESEKTEFKIYKRRRIQKNVERIILHMMKKTLYLALIALCVFQLTGCSGVLRKKFVRDKGEPKKETPVFKPEVYENEFTTRQRYANHFAFWKGAAAELIDLIYSDNRNDKRMRFFASYTLEEANQMHKLLVDEKQKEMEPLIRDLAALLEKTNDDTYISTHKNTLVRDLKHIKKQIEKNFSYNKMQNYLRQMQ
ncbi:MAG: hypothetical protein JW946_00835, partial [Candidatus Omnitrophica bacterium]|nr:hypothetical protein [Candidatus Omnitrophota bacterium]